LLKKECDSWETSAERCVRAKSYGLWTCYYWYHSFYCYYLYVEPIVSP